MCGRGVACGGAHLVAVLLVYGRHEGGGRREGVVDKDEDRLRSQRKGTRWCEMSVCVVALGLIVQLPAAERTLSDGIEMRLRMT